MTPNTDSIEKNGIKNFVLWFEPKSCGKYLKRTFIYFLNRKYKIPILLEGFCFKLSLEKKILKRGPYAKDDDFVRQRSGVLKKH